MRQRTIGLILLVLGGVARPVAAQTPAGHAHDIYRATLEYLFVHDSAPAAGRPSIVWPERLVIADSTAFGHHTSRPPDSLRVTLRSQFPAASAAVVNDLLSANGTSGRPDLPPFPVRTVLLPPADIRALFTDCREGWRRFYARFPGSQGIMHVSRVGLDAARHQALVYIGNQRGCLDGVGMVFLLERGTGGWRVLAYQMMWIS